MLVNGLNSCLYLAKIMIKKANLVASHMSMISFPMNWHITEILFVT